jgi:2-(1,2-epoxy-1,2-dihydrophenyl)acetyl-CoA isomerase
MDERERQAESALLVDAQEEGIWRLTLNRPRSKNAVSFEMWAGFAAFLDRIEADTPPRAVILQGADSFFSIGGDVKAPPARGEGALAPAARLEQGQRVINRLRALPSPVIAAVEGGAFGIGLSLALSCDIVFASETAIFGAPFIDFGVVPDGGAAWYLTKRLGRARAAELIFSGRTIQAAEALSLGLVSRLAPAGQVADAALEFARNMGHGNRLAAELTKRLLHAAETADLSDVHALELAYCAACQTGPEMENARRYFASLRKGAREEG